MRISKDFGDNVLPLRYGGYYKTSMMKPTAEGDWDGLLFYFKILLECVQGGKPLFPGGEPGWHTIDRSNDAIIMFLPTESVMARRWASDDMGLAGTNSTTLSLLDTS